jgi:MoaA/NifB/PqqE/SkfB family radical SAM enzyme
MQNTNSSSMLNTGFSEITEERLNYQSNNPWYLEVAITGSCNFNCKYCNRFSSNLNISSFNSWLNSQPQLHHIQITGGEPTIHPQFNQIINSCKPKTKILGLSTNGSWPINDYLNLPVDMFSISFDDYDLNILKSRGYKNPEHILNVIKSLAQSKYVNVGLVVDELNVDRIENIIDFLLNLNISDIKLSISTKSPNIIPIFTKSYDQYPILNYRVNNFNNKKPMRGYPAKYCHITKNDVTIVGENHYPCLVYFREKGQPIGNISDPNMMKQREDWSNNHNCHLDPICSKFCMDFKCDFNHAKNRLPVID